MQDETNKIISLAEASNITGYTQDYLGFLCRTGKLEGQKIGRNWTTTRSALEQMRFDAELTYGPSQVQEHSSLGGTKIPVKVLQSNGSHEVDRHDQILNPLPSTLYPASVIPLALHSFSEGESAVDPSRLASQSEAEESLSSYPVIPEATKGYLESTDPDFHQDDKQIQNDIKSEESGSTFEKTFVVGLPISLSALSQGLNEDSKVSPALVRATSLNLSKRNSPAYFSVATFAITLSLLASIFWIKPDLFESFLNNSNGGLTVTNKPVKITNQISKKNVDDGKVLAAQSVTQARVTPAVLTQFELEKLIMESLAAAESLGFFRGPQGPAGTNGTTGTNPSGPIYIQPYIPSVPTSSNPGGTLAGFTDLSSQRFITDDATIDDQLTVNGAATFAGDVEVTGTITAGGITGTINPGLTEGSIIFQGPAGLAQDNANFFWNNTSNRLGIGTLSPAANIHSLATTEQLRLGYDTTNYTSLTTSSTGVTTFSFNGSAPQAIFIPQVDSGSAFDFQDSAGDSLFRIDTSGRIVNVGENDGSAKFNIDATITSATSFIYGQNISVDADNSLFGNVNALNIELEGAFAGSTSTNGIRSFNTLNSTATQLFTNSVGNSGVTGIVSNSTVGHNAGLLGASFGSSSLNSGVFGTATSSSNSPVRNIGVVGQALNATNNIGGYFYLGSTTPSGFTSTALLANNGSQSAPIFIAQDNASQVFIIADGGNVGIGSDSSPVAGLTVGDDTGATIASGAGDAYVQNDLEVDGTLTVAGATTYSGALSVITTTSPQLTVGYDSSNKFTTAVASDGGTAWAMLGTDADLNINFAGATDGDFSINTDDLFVDTSNGRVGIGTAVPSYGLHVQNDLGLGISRSTGRFWQIVPDATDQSTLRILTNGNSNALVLSASSDSYSKIYSESPIMSISGANAGSLYLNVGEPGSGGSVILGKRVGDDLILPTKYEFYAAGAKTANYSGVLFNNTATSSTGSVNKYGLEIQNTGTWDGSSANNVGLYVSSVTGGTNNYDAIFNGGGNVGIGTMTPAAKLEVTNNADSSTLLQITNTTAGTSAQAALQVTSNAGYVGFYKYSTTRTTYKTAVAPDAILYNSAGGNITILNDNASGNINFTAGGASTAQMVINNLGNVGIGTSAPLSGKLDIRGPLGTASWKTLPTDGTGGFNYGLAFVQDDSTASGTTGYFRMVNTDGTLVSGRNILGLQIAGGGDHLLVPGNTGLVDMSADNIFRFCGGSGSCITASELLANKIRLSPSFATADALADPGDGGVHFPGNSYFATSTGSVGVATATPRSKLEVYGDLRYGGSSPISATTVSDNPLTLGATTVNVSSTTGYPTSGTLVIDSESMTYTGISGNAFTGVTRGVLGTTAVSHVSGSRIDYYLSIAQRNDTTPKFTLTSAGRAAFGRATASTSYSGGLYPTVEIGALDNTFPQAVTGSAYLSLNSGAGAIPGLVFARDSVQQWVIVDRHDDPGRLSFMNATSSQIFNFLQNGSFGINDTSPDANLEVVNDGIGDSFLVADSADGDTTPFVINSVGRVGIGTATPTATETYSYLTVQGSDATAVASTVINTGIGQAANVLSNATARWSMYIPGGGTSLNFYSNTSTDVVTFANDGDVGIGTTDPQAPLDVRGGDIYLERNQYLTARDTATTSTRGLIRWLSASDELQIGSTNSMIVNFGSDTDPFTKLWATTNDTGIEFDNDTQKSWRLANEGSGGAFATNGFIIRNMTDSVNALFMSNAGSVAMGNTSPTALLDVNNTTSTAITAAANARVLNVQGAFTEAASGVHARIVGMEITPPTITAGGATVTNTASLYISDAPTATVTGGNYSLWVDSGNSRFDGVLQLNGGSFPSTGEGMELIASNDIGYIQVYNRDTSSWGDLQINAEDLTVTAYGGFTTFNGGNVGIGGDLSPDASLEVVNDGSGDSFLVADSADGDTTPFVIQADGDVGVGMTTPGAKLEVASEQLFTYPTMGLGKGTIHISPVAAINDDTTAITFGANSGGTLINSAQAGIYVQSSVTYGTKMYFGTTDVYATGSQARMMIDQLGNVGIGTVSPQNKLDIEGGAVIGATYSGTNTAPTNGLLVEGNVGIGTISPVGKFSVTSGVSASSMTLGSTTGISQSLNLDGTGWGMYFGLDTATGNGWIQQGRTSASTAYNLLLQASGGNVGIGTVSPGALLDIGTNAEQTVPRLRVIGYSDTVANIEVGDGASVYWKLRRGSGNDITMTYSSLSMGNSGISDPAPGTTYDLKIGGTNASIKGLAVLRDSFFAGLLSIGADVTPDANLEINNDSSGDSFLVNDGGDGDTTPFVIQADGDVGIGTASPTEKLSVVAGTLASGVGALKVTGTFPITSGATAYGTSFDFVTARDSDTSTNYAVNIALTSSYVAADGAGREVGGLKITTTDPGGNATLYGLKVDSAALGGTTSYGVYSNAAFGGNNSYGVYGTTQGGPTAVGVYGESSNTVGTRDSYGGMFRIVGNVTQNAYGVYSSPANAPTITGTYYGMYSTISGSTVTGAKAAGLFTDGTTTSTFNTGTYAALFSGGNVGIGDTTPSAKLEIDNSAGSNVALKVTAASGQNTQAWVASNASQVAYMTEDGALVLTNQGLNQTANYNNSFGGAGLANVVLALHTPTTSSIALNINGIAAQTSNYLNITSGGGSTGDVFNILSSGNVGIGDVSPAAGLTVGADTTAGVANGAGDAYIQSDLEVDGSTTTALLTTGNVTLSNTTTTINSVNANPTISFQGNAGTFFEISRPNGNDTLLTAQTTLRLNSNLRIESEGKLMTGGGLDLFVDPDTTGTLVLGALTTSETTHVIELAESTVLRSGESLQWTTGIIDTAGNVGIGTISPDAKLEIAGNLSSAAWGLNGIQLQNTAGTYTDTSTAAAGTATNAVFNSFGQPTLAATNAITTTNAANVYIAAAPAAGTNQTITNAYALWVDAGVSRFDDDVRVGNPAAGDTVLDSYGRAYIDPGNVNFGVDTGLAVSARHPSTNSLTVQQMTDGFTDQTYPLQVWNRLDGATMASMSVRGELRARSSSILAMSTHELTGDIDPAASTTVTGTNTSFDKELMVGDRITVSGETRTVTAIASQTSLTVDTAFSDNANDTTPDRLPVELSVLDSSLNIDFIVQDNGNVGVGVATPGYKFDVQTNTASTYAAYFFNDGNDANRYGIQIQGGADDASGTTYYLRALDGDGGEVGYIANTSGTFALTDSSDVRTKTNITNTIEEGIATIMQLRVVDFNRLADPDGPRITGFIAQEVNEVYPKIVNESPNGYLGISKENLIPILVKAMQEQQAELQSVKSLAQSLQGLGNGILQVDSLVVNSHVAFNEDTVGQAKILGTDSKVRISFTKQYEYQPVVTVTPMEFATIPYRVTEVDVTGFTIEFASVIGYDVTFNWHSFGSKEGKLTISDGTKQDIAIIVPQAPNPNVAQIQENNLVVDGSGTVPIDGQAPTESGVINETSSPQILEVPQGDSGSGGGNGNGNGNTGLPTIQEIVPVSSESSPST